MERFFYTFYLEGGGLGVGGETGFVNCGIKPSNPPVYCLEAGITSKLTQSHPPILGILRRACLVAREQISVLTLTACFTKHHPEEESSQHQFYFPPPHLIPVTLRPEVLAFRPSLVLAVFPCDRFCNLSSHSVWTADSFFGRKSLVVDSVPPL